MNALICLDGYREIRPRWMGRPALVDDEKRLCSSTYQKVRSNQSYTLRNNPAILLAVQPAWVYGDEKGGSICFLHRYCLKSEM